MIKVLISDLIVVIICLALYLVVSWIRPTIIAAHNAQILAITAGILVLAWILYVVRTSGIA